ncbi:MAG: acylphosphatase [Gammaproteobacteria bacterium]
MMQKQCRHYFVRGKVQGVWYRASTREIALKLGVTGWAKNLSDRRVEIMACGTEKALNQFSEWLWQGPPAAIVTEVSENILPHEHFDDFTTG